MGTALLGFNKNSNIGLYAFATDEYVLVGNEVSDAAIEIIEKNLQVPVHQISIAGTSLIGVFLAGTAKKVIVPSIVFDSELKKLDELGINYEVLKTNLTCLGNNIIANDHGAIISFDFPKKDLEEIRRILERPVFQTDISETTIPGACIAYNGNTGLIHRDASTKQIELVEETLMITLTPTTINMGSPYIKSGILCNKNGLLIGESSGPAEITYAESGLGYVEG